MKTILEQLENRLLGLLHMAREDTLNPPVPINTKEVNELLNHLGVVDILNKQNRNKYKTIITFESFQYVLHTNEPYIPPKTN